MLLCTTRERTPIDEHSVHEAPASSHIPLRRHQLEDATVNLAAKGRRLHADDLRSPLVEVECPKDRVVESLDVDRHEVWWSGCEMLGEDRVHVHEWSLDDSNDDPRPMLLRELVGLLLRKRVSLPVTG